MAGMPKDTKTRYQGVFARHKQACRVEHGGRCSCHPSYYGTAYDRATSRTRRTRRFPTVDAARNARADLTAALARGDAPAPRGLRLTDAREQFVKAAREGRALNKRGRRYKPTAVDNIEISLKTHAEPKLGHRRITDIRRGDIQVQVVDRMAATHSGSRTRSVVNSLRALYRWAQERDLAGHDPAQHVRLPAMDSTPIERVATPTEFAQLLSVLELADAVAYALAGYGMARAAQIQRLAWRDVDLDEGAIELGVEWEAAKYEASRRVVPTVSPLLTLLKAAFMQQGRPAGDELVCPPRYRARKSGLMSVNGLAKRAKRRWEAAQLEPITLQECRHTAATWLDAAGVSPKVASVLMGHATPERQAGAAVITLARYTHALPDDVLRARDQLAGYLDQARRREVG
jgi:integrase